MSAKFEIFKDKKSEFRFRLRAANGETLATGESYPDKAACKNGKTAIKKAAPTALIENETEVKEAVKKPAATRDKTAAKPKATVTQGTKPRGWPRAY